MTTPPRLIVSGGGTGGHVYPALSVLDALRRPPFEVAPEQVRYLGIRGRVDERLVPEAGYPFVPIASGPVLGRNPATLAVSLFRILAGTLQALSVILRFQPDAVFATGGYVSVPVVLAAWLARVPALLYLPDAEPGLAVRALARIATRVAVTVPPRRHRIPSEKLAVTGYPVRPGLGVVSREEGAGYWRLDRTLQTVLVWGGSQGARAVNREIAGRCAELVATCQVLHVTGAEDYASTCQAAAGLSEPGRARYLVREYLHEGVPEALAAADLAVSRSGASVLGEFPAAALPSILVPYPHAGAHQALNASYLTEAGAAVLLPEDRVEGLVPLIQSLLKDRDRLGMLRRHAAALARPGAAASIAELLVGLAAARPTRARTASGLTK